MTCILLNRLSCQSIPHLHKGILPSRNDRLTIRRPRQRIDRALMLFIYQSIPTIERIPHLRRPIKASRCYTPPIQRPPYRKNSILVSICINMPAANNLPHLHRTISKVTTRSHISPIRRPCHTAHKTLMALISHYRLTGKPMPNPYHTLCTPRSYISPIRRPSHSKNVVAMTRIYGFHQCSFGPSVNKLTACGNTGRIHSRHSLTALGLPGRLIISVRPRVPATPRESIPKGVCCRLTARIASAIPGASRSITAFVASGVTSRGARPVPPVVRIRLTFFSSLHSRNVASISSRSSGIIAPAMITASGSSITILRIRSPLLSSRIPLAPLSLIVNTPIVIITLYPYSERPRKPQGEGRTPCCLLSRGVSGSQFAHNRPNLATRTIEPHSIRMRQFLNIHLTLHHRSKLTCNIQQLPSLSLPTATRTQSQPPQTLILTQRRINQRIQLLKPKNNMQLLISQQ